MNKKTGSRRFRVRKCSWYLLLASLQATSLTELVHRLITCRGEGFNFNFFFFQIWLKLMVPAIFPRGYGYFPLRFSHYFVVYSLYLWIQLNWLLAWPGRRRNKKCSWELRHFVCVTLFYYHAWRVTEVKKGKRKFVNLWIKLLLNLYVTRGFFLKFVRETGSLPSPPLLCYSFIYERLKRDQCRTFETNINEYKRFLFACVSRFSTSWHLPSENKLVYVIKCVYAKMNDAVQEIAPLRKAGLFHRITADLENDQSDRK